METRKLTPQEETTQRLRELQHKQISGKVEKVSANIDDSMEINEHEQHLVHVQVETRTWNDKIKDTEVTSNVQKYHPEVFETVKSQLGGTSQKIIHDPRVPKKEAAKVAKAQKETEESKK